MKQVEVHEFGGPEVLQVREAATPQPGAGEVLVVVTSVGMNHADLMARQGTYKAMTGEPPFVPGLEAGGIVAELGSGVAAPWRSKRVVLLPDVPRRAHGVAGGSYRSHFVCRPDDLLEAPANLPDEQLGAVWLEYLTAWGCLVWKQQLQPGQRVGIAAASSAVALAAAQIVKCRGGIAIGLTSHAEKISAIQQLPACCYDHLIATHHDGHLLPFHRQLKELTGGEGVDVFFDPIASGAYLASEILSLAQGGVVWVYGLLGEAGPVNIQPLIIRRAAIRGWVLSEMVEAGRSVFLPACRQIISHFADGTFHLHVARTFALDEVVAAHRLMEESRHVGKLVLVP